MTERSCAIPKLTKPVELVHLSDFHASVVVSPSLIERAIDMAIDLKPHLFCVTGDFVTCTNGFDPKWYTSVLARLAAKAPTFAVLGNHDGGLWCAGKGGFRTPSEVSEIVERAGIQLLHNRCSKIPCNGEMLQIVGVGDLWSGHLMASQAFEQADAQCPTILLSHNPDGKVLVADYAWNLMLSGHTHGGQVVMPVTGLSPAPVWDKAYVAGMKPWRGRWIHVSRGVGNALGVRFNCRPEITRIRLLPMDS